MKSNVELQSDVYEELKWDSRVNEGVLESASITV